MPEFKSREEYHKWKAARAKQPQQNENKPKEIKQSEPVKTKSPYIENKFSKKKMFLFIGIILVILIPVVYLLWSYMTHGKLSGNVYATMKSGDVKKAAGIEIYLLKIEDSNNFFNEIKRLKHETKNILDELYGQAEERKKYVDMDKDMYEFNKEKAEHFRKLRDEYVRKVFEQDADKYRGSYLENLVKYEDVLAKIDKAKKDHNTKIMELFYPCIIKKNQTDVNGSYSFSNIENGIYFLYCSYKVFNDSIEWLYPIEVNQRENKLDLTNNNMNTFQILYDL